ncbi:Protein of unknown function [Desulfonauticus submarinus]|uniref:Uncharacterized protein n=1 Tax=Desulfonauticus submarinus TaxID=206665 RepID=A0A1H0GAD3_9BACT|nr:DUF1804 family protein [Desulfonauticus submarinus]SDO03847.1 Protein of unknown function [Desulfonauticus submarinus]
MAYKKEIIEQARKLYADGLSFAILSKKLNISEATLRRWKTKDKSTIYDWDRLRYTNSLSEDSVESINKQILTKFLDILNTTIQEVQTLPDLDPQEKVKALASLGDTFNKMVSAMKKTTPEVAVADVALKVLEIVFDVIKEDQEITTELSKYLDAINQRITKEFA